MEGSEVMQKDLDRFVNWANASSMKIKEIKCWILLWGGGRERRGCWTVSIAKMSSCKEALQNGTWGCWLTRDSSVSWQPKGQTAF